MLNLGSTSYNWNGKNRFLQPCQIVAEGTFSHLACNHRNRITERLWLGPREVICNRLLRTSPSSSWIWVSPKYKQIPHPSVPAGEPRTRRCTPDGSNQCWSSSFHRWWCSSQCIPERWWVFIATTTHCGVTLNFSTS